MGLPFWFSLYLHRDCMKTSEQFSRRAFCRSGGQTVQNKWRTKFSSSTQTSRTVTCTSFSSYNNTLTHGMAAAAKQACSNCPKAWHGMAFTGLKRPSCTFPLPPKHVAACTRARISRARACCHDMALGGVLWLAAGRRLLACNHACSPLSPCLSSLFSPVLVTVTFLAQNMDGSRQVEWTGQAVHCAAGLTCLLTG